MQNNIYEIVSLANTEINGRYIFAGSKVDSIPFEQDGTYNGDSNAFTIKIGKDATVAVGSDGEAVFGGIFQTLEDFRDAVENNDTEGIRDSMDGLDDFFDDVAAKVSDIGSKISRMEIKEKIFQDSTLFNTDRLSKIEDADIAEAIIELEEIELAYQAALSSSSTVMKLSLVDYL